MGNILFSAISPDTILSFTLLFLRLCVEIGVGGFLLHASHAAIQLLVSLLSRACFTVLCNEYGLGTAGSLTGGQHS